MYVGRTYIEYLMRERNERKSSLSHKGRKKKKHKHEQKNAQETKLKTNLRQQSGKILIASQRLFFHTFFEIFATDLHLGVTGIQVFKRFCCCDFVFYYFPKIAAVGVQVGRRRNLGRDRRFVALWVLSLGKQTFSSFPLLALLLHGSLILKAFCFWVVEE